MSGIYEDSECLYPTFTTTSVADALFRRILEAQELALKDEVEVNTIVLNGNKYGYIKESPKYITTLFGMNVETENMPRDYDFLIQWRPEKPQTNGDRIRAMTDEELADFIASGIPSAVCKGTCVDDSDPCELCVLDWLKQKAEEGE